MSMTRFIEHKDGHTVDVRADLAESLCACVHCKGRGRESRSIYYNPDALVYGGIIAQWSSWACCVCGGHCTLPVSLIH